MMCPQKNIRVGDHRRWSHKNTCFHIVVISEFAIATARLNDTFSIGIKTINPFYSDGNFYPDFERVILLRSRNSKLAYCCKLSITFWFRRLSYTSELSEITSLFDMNILAIGINIMKNLIRELGSWIVVVVVMLRRFSFDVPAFNPHRERVNIQVGGLYATFDPKISRKNKIWRNCKGQKYTIFKVF